MTASWDPYEVLGVPRTASKAEIRAAYVARARLAHPDLVGRNGLDIMRALNEAWAVLKDAARRQAWDAAHHVPGSTSAPGATSREEEASRPFWTGAMGKPPGGTWGRVLDFGIYDGWSLGEIARRDRGYLIWLRDRPEAAAFRDEILRLLDPEGGASDEPRGGRRRW